MQPDKNIKKVPLYSTEFYLYVYLYWEIAVKVWNKKCFTICQCVVFQIIYFFKNKQFLFLFVCFSKLVGSVIFKFKCKHFWY